jgi:hypothetical protein
MDNSIFLALENLYSVICLADNAVGELREKISPNSSFFTTLTQYETTIKKARVSWDIIKKELDK